MPRHAFVVSSTKALRIKPVFMSKLIYSDEKKLISLFRLNNYVLNFSCLFSI